MRVVRSGDWMLASGKINNWLERGVLMRTITGQLCLSTFFALTLRALPGIAQVTGSESPSSVEQQDGNLTEITVTAQRRTERLVDVPLSVSVASGNDLAKAAIPDLQGLGELTPGLLVLSTGTYIQPTIRGVASTGGSAGEDPSVALYVDGNYEPNKIGDLMDLPDVERIEVLKGPQGTLYGRNADAGAIVIHTIDPSLDHVWGQANAGIGFYSGGGVKTGPVERTSEFLTGPLLDNVLAGSIAVHYEHTNGYLVNQVTDGTLGHYEDAVVRPKLLFQPADYMKFILAYTFTDQQNGEYVGQPYHGNTVDALFPGAIVPTQPWHVASELGPNQESVAITHGVTLRSEIDVADIGHLSSETGYEKVHSSDVIQLDQSYSPACMATFACGVYDAARNDDETYQENLSFASNSFGIVRFLVGGTYYHDIASFAGFVFPQLTAGGAPIISQPVAAEAPAGEIKIKAAAGFAEVTLDVTPKLHLTGGERYSWEQKIGFGSPNTENTIFGELGAVPPLTPGQYFPATGAVTDKAWTPRASIRYDLTGNANVYFTYSKGFKSSILNGTNFTNDYARPETLTSYEVGAKASYGKISANIAAFHYDLKDIQTKFNTGYIVMDLNAAAAKIDGIDADVRAAITSDWTARLGFSYLPVAKYTSYANGQDYALPILPTTGAMALVTVDATGERMLRAPKWNGNAGLDYSHDTDVGQFTSALNVAYSSTFSWDLLNRVKTSDYALVNLTFDWQPKGSILRYGIYGTNLGGRAVIMGNLLFNNVDGVMYGPPREIGVRVSAKF